MLDHAVHTVASVLGKPDREVTAGQHRMDKAYFDRISVLDFAISHDDGQGIATVGDADILLVGVSRSSKTPTSIYLANRGYKVANYPLVPGVPMPLEDIPHENMLVVGLIKDARRLAQIRRNRLHAMNESSDAEYAGLKRLPKKSPMQGVCSRTELADDRCVAPVGGRNSRGDYQSAFALA